MNEGRREEYLNELTFLLCSCQPSVALRPRQNVAPRPCHETIRKPRTPTHPPPSVRSAILILSQMLAPSCQPLLDFKSAPSCQPLLDFKSAPSCMISHSVVLRLRLIP
ncbi:unnamed protein product [Meloidogyne enterolobii]|uniref:Uncharacterized protein n=1 Tax=Meloidogyne enterolobii TaxID=390850 RepID=A0ACB1AJZ8_MELEN